LEAIQSAVRELAPDYAINCIGILNSQIDPSDCRSLTQAIEVNSRFPHQLALATAESATRVIHISTDGVFSGLKNGPYEESDPADAIDDYGRTKALGECRRGHVLNLRCSIVGRDPARGRGLLEWLLRVPDGERVDGYVDQMWNGVTTRQLGRFCVDMIQGESFDSIREEGHVLHFCPNPAITKYELLKLWRDLAGKDVTIQPTPRPKTVANRVLASECKMWRRVADFTAPPWSELLKDCI
jgi:dTDP-4-dehydrorhamnose reductase